SAPRSTTSHPGTAPAPPAAEAVARDAGNGARVPDDAARSRPAVAPDPADESDSGSGRPLGRPRPRSPPEAPPARTGSAASPPRPSAEGPRSSVLPSDLLHGFQALAVLLRIRRPVPAVPVPQQRLSGFSVVAVPGREVLGRRILGPPLLNGLLQVLPPSDEDVLLAVAVDEGLQRLPDPAARRDAAPALLPARPCDRRPRLRFALARRAARRRAAGSWCIGPVKLLRRRSGCGRFRRWSGRFLPTA